MYVWWSLCTLDLLACQYGQIHVVFKEMVLEKYGQELWARVLSQAELDAEQDFLQFRNYPDASFCRMIIAITDCVDESLDEMLEEFGDFFIKYCLSFGYDNMLRTLGGDIVSFVQNLDSLHSLLSLTYMGINPPSFRCEKTTDGGLLLHYYSCRSGLAPLVTGLIRAASREIFGHVVDLTVQSTVTENMGHGKTQQHTVFNLHFADLCVLPSSGHGNATARATPTDQSRSSSVTWGGNGRCSANGFARSRANHGGLVSESRTVALTESDPQDDGVTLSGQQFCKTFPYHVFFDTQLNIIQCGDALKKVLPAGVGPGSNMEDAFGIQYPRMAWSFDNILRFTNAIFMLSVLPNNNTRQKMLNIKGQMILVEEEERMMFIGSPSIKSLKEMKEINLYMSDIPLFDVTREIVLLYEQRNAEIGITQMLDQTTAELKRISRALEVEKQKTEQLLHQMLPPKVATQLKNGHIVEAETFQTATIMFSDVVTFTNIAAACPPEKIVNMLNDMYERFDNATTRWNVYKVETIGDAYMVVGGVPERSADHAQRVARFAMDIVGQAALVPSPSTGMPLQIRVGVHTGSVMAGVVGVKMPRYCLFGDTVNTASRMESHGIPGRIHVSAQTFRCLADSSFRFKRRGSIQVKGKGCMTTYFLIGDSDVTVHEPDDEFTSLPLIGDVTTLFVTSVSKMSMLDSDEPSSDTLSRLHGEHFADNEAPKAIIWVDDEQQGERPSANNNRSGDLNKRADGERVRITPPNNEQVKNTSANDEEVRRTSSDGKRRTSADGKQGWDTSADNKQVKDTSAEYEQVKDSSVDNETLLDTSGGCGQSLGTGTNLKSVNNTRTQLLPRVVKPDYTFLSTQPLHGTSSTKAQSKLCAVL